MSIAELKVKRGTVKALLTKTKQKITEKCTLEELKVYEDNVEEYRTRYERIQDGLDLLVTGEGTESQDDYRFDIQEIITAGKCYRCGQENHRANVCKFRSEFCRRCNKLGHIARVCQSGKGGGNTGGSESGRLQGSRSDSRKTHQVDEENSTASEDYEVNVLRTVKTDKFMADIASSLFGFTATAYSSTAEELIQCDKNRSFLNNCLSKLPQMLRQAELHEIPSSKKDVDATCNSFKTGMKCFDDYSHKCLVASEQKKLDDYIVGARYTFRFLCDDPSFQAQYLKYTTCFKGISKDWDHCADIFLRLIKEEISRTVNVTASSRLIELCCAKHGFLKCIYIASRLKCLKEEAIFIQRIADTLSSTRVYLPHCDQVEADICSRGRHVMVQAHLILVATILWWNFR